MTESEIDTKRYDRQIRLWCAQRPEATARVAVVPCMLAHTAPLFRS